ncbi:MAG TPA: hypothetical protein VF179_32195 [Thermoanaerobaculia bacterium]|nr:hypothetical protein [Thermoanaerobaculia bacterium]
MNATCFHLAWFKLNTDFFMSGKPTSEPAHVIAELRRLGGAGV